MISTTNLNWWVYRISEPSTVYQLTGIRIISHQVFKVWWSNLQKSDEKTTHRKRLGPLSAVKLLEFFTPQKKISCSPKKKHIEPMKFKSLPLKKWWLEDDPFLLGFGNFSGANCWTSGGQAKHHQLTQPEFHSSVAEINPWVVCLKPMFLSISIKRSVGIHIRYCFQSSSNLVGNKEIKCDSCNIIWAIYYKSLSWMFRPFWVGFPC